MTCVMVFLHTHNTYTLSLALKTVNSFSRIFLNENVDSNIQDYTDNTYNKMKVYNCSFVYSQEYPAMRCLTDDFDRDN